MRMFDQFNRFFSVGNTISPSANTQPDDVLKTKSALAQIGDYKVPDFGITDIPDQGMIDGLKKFQQKNGLKIDGVMKPGGPTEAKLGETMANLDATNTDAKAKPKVPKIDPLTGLPEVKMPKLKKPTTNLWEQTTQQKKSKIAVLPKGNTVPQRIASLMQDKRYQDKLDSAFRDHVTKQFKRTYPGQVEYDETGKKLQAQAAIIPKDVEASAFNGELKNIEQTTKTNAPTAEAESVQESKTECASKKEELDQAYQDWQDADDDYKGQFEIFQDQVNIADQAWEDLIDTLTGAGVSSSELPDMPEHDDEEKPKKNRFSWAFFRKILEKALTAYEIGKYLDDVADAYWNYDRELETLEIFREKIAAAQKTANNKWLTYSDLKKEYEQKCGK